MFFDKELPLHSTPPPSLADSLLRAVLLSPNTVVFATDAEGILTYINGTGLNNIGVKPGEGIGQHIADFFQYTPIEREKIIRVFAGQPLATGTNPPSVPPSPVFSFSTTSVVHECYIELSLSPSYDPDGTITGLIGFSTSMTERQQIREELLPKQELLGDLFDSIPEITHILDRDFRILAANKASRSIFVDTQIIGATCYRMISGQDRHCPWCPVLTMYNTGQPTQSEFYDDLRNRYQKLSCFPLRDQEGNIIGAVEMATDVTDKREAQQALQKNEALLSDLFSSISDGMLVIDREYTILRANRVMENQYPDNLPLIDKKCFELLLRDSVCPDCPAAEMFKTQKTVVMERYCETADTTPGAWFDHAAHPIFDQSTGEITGAITLTRDITDRKEIEFELHQYQEKLEKLVEHRSNELALSEARLRSILETSSAAISFTDWQGNFTYVNQAHKELFGYSEDELYGRPTLMFSDGSDEDHQGLADMLEGKKDFNRVVTQMKAKDGRTIWADISASVVRGSDPTETQLISIIVDVTARQLTLAELNRARIAAEEASREKSQFLATMSHEIRTPLNGVIGLSDLLLTTSLQPKQGEYAKLIKASGKALLYLINDILDFSKIEAGKLELETIAFDLHEMAESVVGILMAQASEQNLQLAVTFDPKIPRPMRGDGGRLRQVLLNLVGNGLKFTRSGGVRIHVSPDEIRETEMVVRFEVIDTGIGIPEERLHRLFQPFSQVDASSARVYGGTGLGLAICKKLIELMGGTVGVKSAAGEGSTFWFSVTLGCAPEILLCMRTQPLCVKHQTTHCHWNLSEICLGCGHNAGLDLKLLAGFSALIVSANAIQRQSLKAQLGSWGVVAETFSTQADAWEFLNAALTQQIPHHLIIIDTELEDGSGDELIDLITNDKRFADLVIVVLMSLDAEPENTVYQERGVRYFRKPVYCETLFETVVASFLKEQFLSSASFRKYTSVAKTLRPARKCQNSLRVLVAEDNRINQIVITEILHNAGMSTKVVVNGREACDAVQSEPFDVVVMDCQMPLMDGYEATVEIRNWERSRPKGVSRLPIIALTANATTGDAEKCLQAGMDAYCSKPINPEQIIELIDQWTSAK